MAKLIDVQKSTRIMKAVVLLMFVIAVSNGQSFFVAPNQVNNQCTVNDTTLDQCYTLKQLVKSDILVYPLRSQQQLLFLPGKHFLPENQTLQAAAYKISLSPWDESGDVVIECHQNTDITFEGSNEVKIISMHFTYCTLKFQHRVQMTVISKSIFERSRTWYAITITSSLSKSESDSFVNISNCAFLANCGAIYANGDSRGPVFDEDAWHIYLVIKNSKFEDSWGTGYYGRGGAVFSQGVHVNIYNSEFLNNTAPLGGAMFGQWSSLIINDTLFHKNSAENGTSINLSDCKLELNNCSFVNNSAEGHGGGLLVVKELKISISDCLFQGNHAKGYGGALYAISKLENSVTNCTFIGNSAYAGGALYIKSEAFQSKWGIDIYSFFMNEAKYHNGGAIYCSGARIDTSQGNSHLNTAIEGNGGFAFLENCPFTLQHYSFNISNNSALNGGAIYTSLESDVRFISSTVLLEYNTASYGGALYIKNSKMYSANGLIQFKNNVAFGKGGAMYVVDNNCEETPQCFLQNFESLLFANNSANEGSILYGGLLDRCQEGQKHGIIAHVKKISEYEPTPLAITSDPVKVCLCDKNQSITSCALRDVALNKMRGEKFELAGIVVDQDENPKESFVRARYLEQDAQLDKGEAVVKVGAACQILFFHVFTPNTTATLALQPEGYCELSEDSRITVNISILPCTRGLETSGDRCICDERLRSVTFNDVACSVGNDSIESQQPIWLRYDKDYLLVHTHCPLDYCQAMLINTISLVFPDQQCANNRSGVVCGACRGNYSIALGGSKCLQCTFRYAYVWMVPVFAVAGIALVALLLVCNMTISQGTLNGLIFYANVVSIAGLTSLQNCSIHPILSVFIAWVNLDFGVETCFYSGMDMYEKTWLQFVFPLYIWLLVGVIIVASYYSSTAMKIFGRNNVAVLTTLFLLSYTKFLKTIITALKFTEVLKGSAHNLSDQLMPYKVWIYDGNIEYLKGKHVPLFSTALIVLVVLFIPYTLLLTFGQWLRSMPARRVWLTRSTTFVSIMDAYHAPYRKKHRYWTGLMLLTRCILFLAFASSYRNSELLANMYITTLVLIGIFVLKMTYASRVYKSLFLSLLELSFLLNLITLSTTLYYIRGSSSNDGPICKCTSASIAVSLVIFIGILTYHAYLKAEKIQWFKSIKYTVLSKWSVMQQTPNFHTDKIVVTASSCTAKKPTTSNIELRETLLASEEPK